jgi:hypothetical protein
LSGIRRELAASALPLTISAPLIRPKPGHLTLCFTLQTSDVRQCGLPIPFAMRNDVKWDEAVVPDAPIEMTVLGESRRPCLTRMQSLITEVRPLRSGSFGLKSLQPERSARSDLSIV